MAKVFARTDVVEMFARREMEAGVVPMAIDHRVGPEFITVPRGKNETAGELFEKISQFDLVGFRPRVKVVHVTAGIRRVGVNQIAQLGGCERSPESAAANVHSQAEITSAMRRIWFVILVT